MFEKSVDAFKTAYGISGEGTPVTGKGDGVEWTEYTSGSVKVDTALFDYKIPADVAPYAGHCIPSSMEDGAPATWFNCGGPGAYTWGKEAVEFFKQNPCSVSAADAEGKAAAAASKAQGAKAEETKWAAAEAKSTKEAAELGAEQKALATKAAADNAKANADAAANMADVVAKSEEAAKDSAAADAANDKAQAAYQATLKEISEAGEDADEATKQRLATEKAAADATAAALEQAKSALADAQSDLAHVKAENAKALEDIASDYDSKVADLDAKHKQGEAAFAEEAKEHAAAVADELKNNALNAKAAQDEIAQEAADNKAAAAAEHDSIEDLYGKKEAAQQAANEAWQAKADADAKALAATRAETQAKFEAIAAKHQADYEAKMAHAGELQAAADQAHQAYEDDLAAGEHEQEEADAMTKAELGYGNEIEECATGTQCLDGVTMKCKELGTEFCIASDQFSCAPVPASGECAEFGAAPGQGLATYNVAPALTVAPIPAPTKECIDHIKGAKAAIPGGILASIMDWDSEHEELPMAKFFCDHPELDGATIKKAFEYFMTALEICPMYCIPGTATTVKSTDGKEDLPISHGICLTNADAGQFNQQITALPIYEAQGTNDRFDAANNLADKMCSYATTFTEGWKKGAKTLPGEANANAQAALTAGLAAQETVRARVQRV